MALRRGSNAWAEGAVRSLSRSDRPPRVAEDIRLEADCAHRRPPTRSESSVELDALEPASGSPSDAYGIR